MKITKQRELIETVTYCRDFDYQGHSGWGFSFACDESGNIEEGKNEAARENLARCLANTHDHPVVDRGVTKYEGSYLSPAEGECECCGEIVYLDGFTNTCECGADYNLSGCLLADRSQWGEEIGESVEDILSVDNAHDY